MNQISAENPCGLNGIDFVEFASPVEGQLHNLFTEFGFSKLMKNKEKDVDYYNQNDINFLINNDKESFAQAFSKEHGPSICSMGWRVENAEKAKAEAITRGAKGCDEGDWDLPAIWGIGKSIIYFVEDYKNDARWGKIGFEKLENPEVVENKGFTAIDHLTNNVPKGEMETWGDFYKNIFGFTQVRYFDIRGVKTGLMSYALQSPCKNFCIPINQGTEDKSQINEYLEEYNGPGVQHIAFLTDDILASLDKMKGSGVEMLDIDDEYYNEVFDRVPNVTEDRGRIQGHNVLVDGDDEGYLLQIFTKNIIGPIFIEIIQRKNHYSFGEGNFGALFRSIERDQEKRGYLNS